MTDQLFNQARILNDEIKDLEKTICHLKNIPTKHFSITASTIGGGVDYAYEFTLEGSLLIEFLQQELKKKKEKFTKL